jgi:hypothetical protein
VRWRTDLKASHVFNRSNEARKSRIRSAGFVVRRRQAGCDNEGHEMNAASHSAPDLSFVRPTFLVSKPQDPIATARADRWFAYGIASVYSLMLIVVVVVVAMLWAQ